MRSYRWLGLALLLAVPGWLQAEPQPIPQELAVQIGKHLSDSAAKDKGAPIQIEGDPDKATGLYEENVGGLLVVPLKGAKDGALKGVSEEKGGAVGYLFLYRLAPVIDGKLVGSDKLPMADFKDPEGNERQAAALRLALKKDGEDKWRLFVYGKDGKPLIVSPFRAEENKTDLPISVSVKDANNDQGTLVINVFGKYAADVRLGRMQ
jgi:hypothetical protein